MPATVPMLTCTCRVFQGPRLTCTCGVFMAQGPCSPAHAGTKVVQVLLARSPVPLTGPDFEVPSEEFRILLLRRL